MLCAGVTSVSLEMYPNDVSIVSWCAIKQHESVTFDTNACQENKGVRMILCLWVLRRKDGTIAES